MKKFLIETWISISIVDTRHLYVTTEKKKMFVLHNIT